MSPSSESVTSVLARERLQELLERLANLGLTQQEIATRAGLPPQYLSDIKHGRRDVTELAARRLGEQFDVGHDWLLGREVADAAGVPHVGGIPATTVLPVLPHPIEGDPRAHADWDGGVVEVGGPVAARAAGADRPYLLRFGLDDVQGRLRRGDVVLVSQAVDDAAEIQVVGHRGRRYLARRSEDGDWERLAGGTRLPGACSAVGHCLGIVWGALTER